VDYIAGLSAVELDEADVAILKEKLYAPLNKPGIPCKEVLRCIQNIVYPYEVSIIKSEEPLKNALHKIETLKAELLPQMGAPDAHYLMKLKEVEAIAFITEWYIKASLMRTESRCGHYREDYPDHDDNWLKWIVIGEEGGSAVAHTEEVPIEKYKHKIERYYQDNFKFL